MAEATLEAAMEGLGEKVVAQASAQAKPTGAPKLKEVSEFDAYWALSGVPKRYQDVSFATAHIVPGFQACKSWVIDVKEHRKTGRGLILAGPVGRGKTVASVCILRECAKLGLRIYWVRASTLIDDLSTMGKFGYGERFDELQRRLIAADVLVIDDLGQEEPEAWEGRKIERILTQRHDDMKPTIATTNLSASEMKDRYAERIISRLSQTCERIVFSGPNMRRGA